MTAGALVRMLGIDEIDLAPVDTFVMLASHSIIETEGLCGVSSPGFLKMG